MPNKSPAAEMSETVEAYIDRFSLAELLQIVGEICAAKADHIETNWQDRDTAREWTRAAAVVFRAGDADVIGRISR